MQTATITHIDTDSTVTYVTYTINSRNVTIGDNSDGTYTVLTDDTANIVSADTLARFFSLNPHVFDALQR